MIAFCEGVSGCYHRLCTAAGVWVFSLDYCVAQDLRFLHYFTNAGTYVDMENYQEKIKISDNRAKTFPTNTQKEKVRDHLGQMKEIAQRQIDGRKQINDGQIGNR